MKSMMKNEITVSLIIPVYNSRNYLQGLFDSIARQTYKSFETIIIDDGSLDETPSICKEQCKKDSRFKYFYKKNGGASSARNFGLNKISSNFVMFIDSDDSISDDYVETFVSAYKETGADIVSYKILIPNERKETKKPFKHIISSTDDIIDCFFKEEFGVGPTSKLFQVAKLDGLFFDENLIINEDKLFLFEYLLRCSSAYVSSETKYYVNCRPDSVSNSIAFIKKTSNLLYVQKRISNLVKVRQRSYPHFKQHNIKNLLFIYKMYCRSCDFRIDTGDSLLFEIRKLICSCKKVKGNLSIKTTIELFLFIHFINLYTLILREYYRHN